MSKINNKQKHIQDHTHTEHNRMPNQKHDRQLLRQRAINLANRSQLRSQLDSHENTQMFLHIHLDNNEHYGIPYKYLDEICRPKPITPIPLSAKIIAGVIPYRGELIAVLDLSQMLEVVKHVEEERIKKSWLVIVSIKNTNIALLVNEVRGNYHYRPEELCHSLNNILEAPVDPVQGIFDGKIAILDLTILLNMYQLKLEKKLEKNL